MKTFREKLFSSISQNQSRICIGLDPVLEQFPNEVNESHPNIKKRLEFFFKEVISNTADNCCAFKPQAAMFSSLACEDVLENLINWMRLNYPDHLIIFDGKRSDIGNTSKHYAIEAFERYQSDAATVNPYMGFESIHPFLQNKEKGVYLLCRTSNPGSDVIQSVTTTTKFGEKMPLYQLIAELANSECSSGQLGLVIGANCLEELKLIDKKFPSTPLLLPGVGKQGGTIGSIKKIIDSEGKRSTYSSNNLINVSRSILYPSKEKNWLELVSKTAEQFDFELGAGD